MGIDAEARRVLEQAAFDLAATPKRFISAAQLASYVECDPRTIVQMIKGGSLEGIKVGRAYRIPVDAARRAFHVEQKQAS